MLGTSGVERAQQGEAKAVLVAALIDGGAATLFGRHEVRCPHPARLTGSLGLAAFDPGYAEIGDANSPLPVDEHVVGLEVAVHDTCPVRGGQPLRGLMKEPYDFSPRRVRVFEQPHPQTRPSYVLHRNVGLALEHANVVNRHHARVREPGQRAGLLSQVLLDLRKNTGPQHLECDGAVEGRVVGSVHDAHAPLAELGFDDVASHPLAGRFLATHGGKDALQAHASSEPAGLRAPRRSHQGVEVLARLGQARFRLLWVHPVDGGVLPPTAQVIEPHAARTRRRWGGHSD